MQREHRESWPLSASDLEDRRPEGRAWAALMAGVRNLGSRKQPSSSGITQAARDFLLQQPARSCNNESHFRHGHIDALQNKRHAFAHIWQLASAFCNKLPRRKRKEKICACTSDESDELITFDPSVLYWFIGSKEKKNPFQLQHSFPHL